MRLVDGVHRHDEDEQQTERQCGYVRHIVYEYLFELLSTRTQTHIFDAAGVNRIRRVDMYRQHLPGRIPGQLHYVPFAPVYGRSAARIMLIMQLPADPELYLLIDRDEVERFAIGIGWQLRDEPSMLR